MACQICAQHAVYQPPTTDFNRIQQRRIDKSVVVIAVDFVVTATVTVAAAIAFAELGAALILVGIISLATSGIVRVCCDYWDYSGLRTFLVVVAIILCALGALSFIPIFSAKFLVFAATLAAVSIFSAIFFSHVKAPGTFGSQDTLLTSAIKANRTWLVRFALFLSADPNQKVFFNGNLVTPLQLACHYGNRLSMVRSLLDYHANPNDQVSFSSPLYSAVQNGDIDIALLLLEKAQCTSQGDLGEICKLALSSYAQERERLVEQRERLQKEGATKEQINKETISDEVSKIPPPALSARNNLVWILADHIDINDLRTHNLIKELGLRDPALLKMQREGRRF